MEENINSERAVNLAYNPATLAYFGDAVYELLVRRFVIADGNVKAGQLNNRARCFVTACAQSKAVDTILPLLTESELAAYKTGRNSNAARVPKNASVSEYRKATGLEVLFAKLWLTGETDRINQLFQAIVEGTYDVNEIKEGGNADERTCGAGGKDF